MTFRRIPSYASISNLIAMIGLTIIIIAFPVVCWSVHTPIHESILQKLNATKSSELIKIGEKYMLEDNPDTASECFSIIANRYDPKMSVEEKRILLQALLQRWEILFKRFGDYQGALTTLRQAEKVASEIDALSEQAAIMLYYGNVYQTLWEQLKDKEYGELAFQSYKDAFSASEKVANSKSLDSSFSNITLMGVNLGRMDETDSYLNRYKAFPFHKEKDVVKYNIYLNEACKAYSIGDLKSTLEAFEKQQALTNLSLRNKFGTLRNIGSVYLDSGNYTDAIRYFSKAEDMVADSGEKDLLLTVYAYLAESYRHTGSSLSAEYYNRYLKLKEDILSSQQIGLLKSANLKEQIEEINREMVKEKEKQHKLILSVGIALVFALIMAFFLIVIFRKNRTLNTAYADLHKRNMELRHASEIDRKRLMTALQQLEKSTDASTETEKETTIEEEKETAPSSALPEPSPATEAHEDYLLEMAAVEQRLLESDEYLKESFSISHLACLTEIPAKRLSAIITNTHPEGFKVYLNNLRIMEICRLFDETDTLDHLTMEAIANSVGIKSRTTLVSSFRRVTGLTPSQYLKEAIKKRNS